MKRVFDSRLLSYYIKKHNIENIFDDEILNQAYAIPSP